MQEDEKKQAKRKTRHMTKEATLGCPQSLKTPEAQASDVAKTATPLSQGIQTTI